MATTFYIINKGVKTKATDYVDLVKRVSDVLTAQEKAITGTFGWLTVDMQSVKMGANYEVCANVRRSEVASVNTKVTSLTTKTSDLESDVANIAEDIAKLKEFTKYEEPVITCHNSCHASNCHNSCHRV